MTAQHGKALLNVGNARARMERLTTRMGPRHMLVQNADAAEQKAVEAFNEAYNFAQVHTRATADLGSESIVQANKSILFSQTSMPGILA